MPFTATFVILALLGTALVSADENKDRRYGIRDEAGLFSKDAVKKAEENLSRIHEGYQKDVFIETLKEGPRNEDVVKWAEERARQHRFRGVYVVITVDPHKLEVLADRETRDKGQFTAANTRELADLMLKQLRAGKKDEALLDGTNFALEAFRKNASSRGANNE
jgi:hypothetical protein